MLTDAYKEHHLVDMILNFRSFLNFGLIRAILGDTLDYNVREKTGRMSDPIRHIFVIRLV